MKKHKRTAKKSTRKSPTRCVACGKTIRGPVRVMRLQVTHEDPKLVQRAKELGFTSASWKEGDALQGTFDKNCFKTAILIWKVAFHTRLMSPRR